MSYRRTRKRPRKKMISMGDIDLALRNIKVAKMLFHPRHGGRPLNEYTLVKGSAMQP